MRNRPFFLPVQKSDSLTSPPVLKNLQNKFSGKILFASNLYYLVTGNLTIVDNIENKWFYEELIKYSQNTHDPNLLQVLKKIASSGIFDESLRQRASEAVELIEDLAGSKKNRENIATGLTEKEKAENARNILAGVRYPQTTEVLRLLRDKSAELKRLALWLIGKFKMTDMSQEVCDSLCIPGIEEDAFFVLLTLGNDAGKELKRFYLTSSGNTLISKVILRIFARICPEENMPFIVERLWSNSRQIKETAVRSLLRCGYNPGEEEKRHLNKIIFEVYGIITWIMAGKVCLYNHVDLQLTEEIENEYDRWKSFLLDLLVLSYGNSIQPESDNIRDDKKEGLYIPEITVIVYGEKEKSVLKQLTYEEQDKKKLKKLQRYFPNEIPRYNDLLEDIINCDYNLLSIWTKAITIRNIKKIENNNIGESVVALLFSPEEILQEEAARLIARSGKELYNNSSDRLTGPVRAKLDRIITGEIDEKELIIEKVRFLSDIFPDIDKEALIFLAGKILFIKNSLNQASQPSGGFLLWSFSNENSDPDIFVNLESTDLVAGNRTIPEEWSSCYILPLSAIEEFSFQFPESSFRVIKFIDDNEG